MITLEILVAMVVTVLGLLVEHWFPWNKVVEKPLHQTVNYVMGMLAILVPVTVLFGIWQRWVEIAALWAATVAGGLAVMGAYGIDAWMAARSRMKAAEMEAQLLRPGGNDAGQTEE